MANLNALLVLEDGSFWKGRGFGSKGKVFGEVVFNTGMVGYTEAFTDPSYKGQILVTTYPLIGNYGVPAFKKDEFGIPINFESNRIQISALVAQEICDYPSHPSSVMSIDEWFKSQGVLAIDSVDTREITKRLREKGVMMGAIEVSEDEIDEDKLYSELKKVQRYDERFFEPEKKDVEIYGEGRRIVLIDCGVKYSIIRNLVKQGFQVIRLNYDADINEVLSYKPKGVVFSNGPGNPKKFNKTIELARDLIKIEIPLLGICLGNQIIALSCGADTYKLKYGHRGQNKPCLNLKDGKVYITSQNHGYAVDPQSIKNDLLKIWWLNADDKTIEGLINEERKILAVQFHPEANPGPYDTKFLFSLFREIIEKVDFHA